MSSIELIYTLIVVFAGNNPLVKLLLLLPRILKIPFLLCLGRHFFYYPVKLRLSLLHSDILVDCIHHFHVINFPGIYGFYFLCSWIILFHMLAMSVLSRIACCMDVGNFLFHLH